MPSSQTSFNETMDVLARAGLVKLEIDQLAAEARTCSDPDRLRVIAQEIEVRHASMVEIRRQQLLDQIDRANPKPKKRWWRRG